MTHKWGARLLPLLLSLGLLAVIVVGTRASGRMDVGPMPFHSTQPTSHLWGNAASRPYTIYLPFLTQQQPPYEMRINIGGPLYTTTQGLVYLADQPYTAESGAGYVHAGMVVEWHNALAHPMGGTSDKWLYADYRTNFGEYRFDLPNGNYMVTLHMANIYQHAAGQHAFNVSIESSPVLTDFDLYAAANMWYAIDIPLPVVVTDTQINVVVTPTVGYPTLNAIAVTNQKRELSTPAQPLDARTAGCYNRNLFDWRANTEPDLLGYYVQRTTTIDGALQVVTSPLQFVPYYVDDDVEPGQSYSYTVRAINATGQIGDASVEAVTTPLPFAHTTLPVYELTIAPEHLAQLDADPYSDEYVPAVFRHDGDEFDVEVRYRGSWTNRNTPKKSWKIRFNESQLFQGRQVINLNSGFNDFYLIREKLGYDLFESFGVDGPQASHVHFRLNGKFWGVYTDVEHIDQYFLLRTARPVGSTIYKVGAFGDYRLRDDPKRYEIIYEKRTNPSGGYEDLIAFLELVNNTPDAQFPVTILQVFDVVSYLHYYAAVVLGGNQDIMVWFHNSFLINDPETGRWVVVPWDNGAAFGSVYMPIDHGTPQHVLLTRLLDVPEFRLYYGRYLIEAMHDEFSPGQVDAMVDAYRQLIGPDAECDFWYRNWLSRDYDPDLTYFVQKRSDYVQSVVYDYIAELSLPLSLELTPAGDQLVLRNRGLLDWDVGGMTLQVQGTAELSWGLPINTTVPAGESLILWDAYDTAAGLTHSSAAASALASVTHVNLLDRPAHDVRLVAQWMRQPTQYPIPTVHFRADTQTRPAE